MSLWLSDRGIVWMWFARSPYCSFVSFIIGIFTQNIIVKFNIAQQLTTEVKHRSTLWHGEHSIHDDHIQMWMAAWSRQKPCEVFFVVIYARTSSLGSWTEVWPGFESSMAVIKTIFINSTSRSSSASLQPIRLPKIKADVLLGLLTVCVRS